MSTVTPAASSSLISSPRIAQPAGPTVSGKVLGNPRVGGGEDGRIGRHCQVFAGSQRGGRKQVVDAPRELPTGQIGGRVAPVMNLDELLPHVFRVVQLPGGLVHDLADDHVRGQQLPAFERFELEWAESTGS